MNTKIIAAFCGTGKSFICDDNKIEFECWKYSEDISFPFNIIDDIKSQIGVVDYIFISTNPVVLKELNRQGIEVCLVYPKIELKEEYLKRYIDRGSSLDFIKMLDDNWEKWLIELQDQPYCDHIVLDKGEYLYDFL